MIGFLFSFFGNGADMDNINIYIILRIPGIGLRGNGVASSTGVSFAKALERSSGIAAVLDMLFLDFDIKGMA